MGANPWKVIEASLLQYLNAPYPMELSVSGKLIEVRDVHSENVELWIEVIAVLDKSIEARAVQVSNAEFPIEVSESGKLTEVSAEQFLKALSCMETMEV